MTDYTSLPSGAQVSDLTSVTGVKSSTSGGSTPSHLVLPLQFTQGPGGDKVLATYEQDTLEEVTQSVSVLLNTQVGERYRDAPDYGVPELVSASPVSLAMAETAVKQYEPRASVLFSVSPPASDGSQSVRVNVSLAQGGADTP